MSSFLVRNDNPLLSSPRPRISTCLAPAHLDGPRPRPVARPRLARSVGLDPRRLLVSAAEPFGMGFYPLPLADRMLLPQAR
jgi:hypothetical protein